MTLIDNAGRRWKGLCPAEMHGLDFKGQPCDLCDATCEHSGFVGSQAATWKGQSVEIVDVGRNGHGVAHVLIRFVAYGDGNQGSWVPAWGFKDFFQCGPVAHDMLDLLAGGGVP